MANWKEKVFIRDILEMDVSETKKAGIELAKRLRKFKCSSDPKLLDIIEELENNVDEYDEDGFNLLLQDLYDWADEGHRLWIETFQTEEEANG